MDVPLRVGNEGAGVVTAVGMDSDEDAWELLGKTVGILGGQMYTQYRVVPYKSALELLPDTSPAEGASAFVNPLTVLGMIETMRDEGHTAIVHTAATSSAAARSRTASSARTRAELSTRAWKLWSRGCSMTL